jgi:signal transduction histidine kinase
LKVIDHEDSGKLSAPGLVPAMLHEISQPLTTMRCSLEISLMDPKDQRLQRQSIEQALKDTERVIAMLEELRVILGA